MSGVGYGDHGLVDPDGIPGADLDLAVVSSGAGTIKSGGQSMKTVADDLPAKWQRLSGVYQSPESGQVIALMDPVTDDVHTIGAVARKVASALETYASAAADPKRKLDELRVKAAAFVAEVQHGITRPKQVPIPKTAAEWDAYDPGKYEGQTEHVAWYDDPGTTLQNNNLIREINEQVARLQAAQADCALAIKKASGASVKKAFVAPSESDLNEHGIDLPWSRVGTAKGKTWAEQFEEGFKDDLLKTVMGVVHLAGWDNSGDWSWGTLGSAWKGFGEGAVAFSLLVNPMAWLDAALNPKGQAGQTLGAMGDAAQDWWKDARDNPGIAAGAAASAVGTSLLGPEGVVGRAGRAEELASGLGKLGLRGVEADVRAWMKGGASQANVDALADLVDREYAKWTQTSGYSPALGAGDDAFANFFHDELDRFAREHPDFERLHDPNLIPHGVESTGFLERGGLEAAERAGGHTIDRHVPHNLDAQAFDEFLQNRKPPPKSNSAYSLPVPQVDRLIANALDFNHNEIQDWIATKRLHPKGSQTEGFNWPADQVIGRRFVKGRIPPIQDASVVRVVLKFEPSGNPPYSILTSYPREAIHE